MRTITFVQTCNWSHPFNLDWILNNSLFVFNHSLTNGTRPHVVVDADFAKKNYASGYNCFELDNDACGIRISAETIADALAKHQTSRNTGRREVIDYLQTYFEFYNPGFVNPGFFDRVSAWLDGSKLVTVKM